MKSVIFRFLLLGGLWTLGASFTGCSTTHNSSIDANLKTVCARMLRAIETNNQQAFEAGLDPEFRGFVVFGQLHAAMADRLSEGYQLAYLGQLQKAGQVITLWNVQFQDGGDDILLKAVFRSDMVTAFRLE